MVELPEEAAERFLRRDPRGPQLRAQNLELFMLLLFKTTSQRWRWRGQISRVHSSMFDLMVVVLRPPPTRVKRRRVHGSPVIASSSPLSSLMANVISTSQTSLDFI